MTQQKERAKSSLKEGDKLDLDGLQLRFSEKSKSQLKTKATVIASILGIIPALIIGGSTYYFAGRAIDEEIVRVEREENQVLVANKLEQQRQLLTILSFTTVIAALFGGGIVGFWTNRAINSAMKIAKNSSQLSPEAAKTERTELLTEAIGHIRACIKEQDILDATVEELQRILKCDRAVVYSLEAESRATVVAEAVQPRWPRALGRKIEDPCFDAKYAKEYENGRVRAIENIDNSGMTRCYIDQLKKFKVKANLVTPIVSEGKLLGLLVAHQCDGPRYWQQWEVDLTAQLASQVGFALDNARVLERATQIQKQLENETEWTQYFTDAIGYIRASLQETELLKAVVKEVRGVLSCDRVVIYGLEAENRGVVIAESVTPRWPRALGRKIDDPCFDAKYAKEYENGRVRAIDNIYEAGMTPCYIEQLARLEVKANLVAPILNEGKLLGLLVAHQCDEPRFWQQLEIRWFAQIAIQVGFAIDNARVLAKSNQIQKQLETEIERNEFFTNAIGHIRSCISEQGIIEISVEEVQKILNCDRVVIYGLEAENRGVVIAEAVQPRWPRALGRTIKDPCFDAKYETEYLNGRVRAIDNIYEAGMTSCYVEQLERLEVKANLVAPIIKEGKLLGLLVAHQCEAPRVWQELEINWFAQLAVQIGFAIDNARISERYAAMEKKLAQMSRDDVFMARAELQDGHLLQAELPQLSGRSDIDIENFLARIETQEQTIASFADRIQEIVNYSSELAEGVELLDRNAREDLNDLNILREPIERSLDNGGAIATTIEGTTQAIDKAKSLFNQLKEIESLISDFGERINEQTMNLIIEVGKGEQQLDRDSIAGMADLIYASTQQLTSTVGEIKPVVSEIDRHSAEITAGVDSWQQQDSQQRQLWQQIDSQFQKLLAESDERINCLDRVTKTAAIQLQTSTTANQSLLELSSLAKQTSEQSSLLANYLNELKSFALRIHNSPVEPPRN